MRCGKIGLDYFPLDIDFFHDEKIEFVSAKHGILAELIAIKLLSRIYRNGYFLKWDADTPYLYAKQFGDGITHEILCAVVDEFIKRRFFDNAVFKKYGVLTSKGIQKRYIEITKRRKQTEIFKEYLLLSEDNVNILNENVNIIKLNDDNGTQRKGKERKEKKVKNIYGEFSNVLLTDEELKKLEEKFGASGCQKQIDNLSTYIASKGKKYKSHYATILSWDRKNDTGGSSSIQDQEIEEAKKRIKKIREGMKE